MTFEDPNRLFALQEKKPELRHLMLLIRSEISHVMPLVSLCRLKVTLEKLEICNMKRGLGSAVTWHRRFTDTPLSTNTVLAFSIPVWLTRK